MESRLNYLVADALEGRDFGGRESLFLWREIPRFHKKLLSWEKLRWFNLLEGGPGDFEL